jgi:chromate transporter
LGLIGAACVNIGKISFVDLKSVFIGILVFVGVYRFKVHPILALGISGLLGIVFYGL